MNKTIQSLPKVGNRVVIGTLSKKSFYYKEIASPKEWKKYCSTMEGSKGTITKKSSDDYECVPIYIVKFDSPCPGGFKEEPFYIEEITKID